MTRGKERAHGRLASEDRPGAFRPADREADRDELSDASSDSFPASDPPSSTGMRIGGPSRARDVPSATPRIAQGALDVGAQPTHEPDRHWIARVWPHVQISHAEVLSVPQPESFERVTLRAVVQLAGLTPADVKVTAQRVESGAERAQAETLRLWSVQSHHNGEVVFEATATRPHAVERASHLLVTVEPTWWEAGGHMIAEIIGLAGTAESADRTSH